MHNRTIGFLDNVAAIAYVVFVIGGLVGLLIRKSRWVCGLLLYAACYAISLDIWVWSLFLVYQIWGVALLVVGLLLAGVGVVPMAILATLFHGDWTAFEYLTINALVVYMCRLAATALMESAYKNAAQSSTPETHL